MKKNSLAFLLVFCVADALSAITSTPGLQRKRQLESCTFQWTVTQPLSNYMVYNFTTGNNLPLNTNANYTLDQQKGIVTLTIWDIQLWDAGNYSLSLSTGASTHIDSSALLFVYGYGQSSINQTSGPVPATQGQTVELTCTIISTSVPAAYRPKIYHFWCFTRFYSCLENISSGSAVIQGGDVLNGYSIKNDGRTLVIDSFQYPDTIGISCYGHEEGTTDTSNFANSDIELLYRPYTLALQPSDGKFTAPIGRQVSIYFSGTANPMLTSHTNWSFTNTAGQTRVLPPTAVSTFNLANQFSFTLTFKLTSEKFYGNYSITVANSIGSTTETFQVLRPGPPDAPANFQVQYVSHVVIALQWLVRLDNGSPQTIFIQINAAGNETVAATWNCTINVGTYITTNSQRFSNNIQPATDYEARIWSTNSLGSSEVVKLTTRTLKQMILHVSPEMISFNGSQAIINFATSHGNLASMAIKSCVELTGNCEQYSFDLSNNVGRQVIFNNLPKGNEYTFDFIGYAGIPNKFSYCATTLRGIKVSRTVNIQLDTVFQENSSECRRNPALIAVLGLAVLVSIACFVAFDVLNLRSGDHHIRKQTQETVIRRPDSSVFSCIGYCDYDIVDVRESNNETDGISGGLSKPDAKGSSYS